MSEESIVRNCAPTLAGVKTGSLFSVFFEIRSSFANELRSYRKMFKVKDIEIFPIRVYSDRALMYMFRPDHLRRDLNESDNAAFLTDLGYETTDPYKAVGSLIRRFRTFPCPHEIGLFLSYPLEDVRGFIEHKGARYKYVGLWKVYGDVERCQDMFRIYKQCTESLCEKLHRGVHMIDLIT